MAPRDEKPSRAPGSPFHNPFGGLAGKLGIEARPPPTPAHPPATTGPPAPARAVVRLERKGRGGKTATVIEKLDLRPGDLEAWLLDLKRSLGCGGAVEGQALVLQGDLRDRAAARLQARGVKKVVRG